MSDIETRYESYVQLNSTVLFQYYFYIAQNGVDKAPADFSVHEFPCVAPHLRITSMTCVYVFFFFFVGLDTVL